MTNTTEAKSGELVKADPAITRMEQMMEQNKGQMAALLGKNISVERLFQIALTAVSRVPKLKECTTASVLGCVMESSRMRLPAGVGAGGTWLIPRQNKNTGAMECTLIVDYRAIILMMQRDAGVGPVIAEAVHAKDKFQYGVNSGGPFLDWEPAKGDRGATIGYVAASWSKDDRKLTGVIYKTIDEIKSANMSKSMAAKKGEGPWATDPEWMFKKSVIRPLGKLNPGTETDDLSRAIALDERADLGLPQNLHLLADATAKPELDHAKTYTPPPTPTGKQPTAAEKIEWARAAAGKQGVAAGTFDAWLAKQEGDEEAKAKAAEVAWKRVAAKQATAAEVFAVEAEKAEEPQGQEAEFPVSGAASSEFNGEPAYVIRDTEEPPNKFFTDSEDIYKAAQAAQKAKKKLHVRYIEKASGKNVFRWMTALV